MTRPVRNQPKKTARDLPWAGSWVGCVLLSSSEDRLNPAQSVRAMAPMSLFGAARSPAHPKIDSPDGFGNVVTTAPEVSVNVIVSPETVPRNFFSGWSP